MNDTRNIALEVSHGDADPKFKAVRVIFCENSASLHVGNLTIHIPWTELAQWQLWFAEEMQGEQE